MSHLYGEETVAHPPSFSKIHNGRGSRLPVSPAFLSHIVMSGKRLTSLALDPWGFLGQQP